MAFREVDMKKRMEIADLRVPLALQTTVDIPDPVGGFARQWQNVADVWAAIESFSPHAEFEAGRPQYRISHRITIRWRPDVSVAMQFSGTAGTFAIHGAHDADSRRRFLVCYCEEVLT
jgi:SPP1 family predicted phage head-tail adaptor